MAGYYAALSQAQRMGPGARVVPSGTGTRVTYRAVPPAGGGGGGGFRGGGGANFGSLIQDFQKREEGALAANVAREKEVRGTYADIIGRLQEGGAFRRAGEADIARRSKQLVGKESQNLISSGLYGTTTAASIPTRVESSFAQPARLNLESVLEEKTSQAKLGLAGFVERIETPYPDYNMLLQAMIAQQKA